MDTDTSLVQARKHTPHKITCSVMDYIVKDTAVSMVFFYKESIAHEVLHESLMSILHDFPLFAGRLILYDGKLCINCNNAGVSFSVVTQKHTLDQLLYTLPSIKKDALIDNIDPTKAISHQYPILKIKLTHLACGGTVLGVCWHHSLGDVQTLMYFMHSWAHMVNKHDIERPLIVTDRDTYLFENLKKNDNTTPGVRYLTRRDLLHLRAYMLLSARNKRTLRFYFSVSELETMKQVFSENTHRTLSTNDVVCAHLFRTISSTDAWRKSRMLSMAVNYRSRVQLPPHLLGNFVTTLNILASPEVTPFQFADELRTAVDNFQRLHLDFFSTQTYLQQHGGLSHLERCLPTTIDPLNRTLVISNWSKFGVYDIAFGDVKPCAVIPLLDEPVPWMSSLIEGFSQAGLLYTVSLPGSLAKKLMHGKHLKSIHQYRNQHDVLPELVEKLDWIL